MLRVRGAVSSAVSEPRLFRRLRSGGSVPAACVGLWPGWLSAAAVLGELTGLTPQGRSMAPRSKRSPILDAVGVSSASHMDIRLLPGVLFERLHLRADAQHHLNVLLSVVAVATAFVVGDVLGVARSLPHVCLVEHLLSIPCPGCGMTRSLALIARGDVKASLTVHPCGVLLVAGIAVQSITRVVRLARSVPEFLADGLIRTLNHGMLAALIAVWAFRVITKS